MKNRILKNMEWPILICVIILTVIGCLELFSVGGQSEYAEFKKQILWFAISIPITVLIITIDYNIISKISPFLYVIMIGLLIGVLFTKPINGATSWYNIGSVSFQPSEFAKIILILCTAVFLEKNYENLNMPKVLAKLAVFLAVPVGLIVAEPDLSTSICVMATLFIIIFVGGLSLKLIGIMILILVPAFGGFIWYIQQDNLPQLLKTYQINRILGFIYGSEYGASSDQQDNSVMAIGSGQLSGKGINNSTVATVKDTNLISEQQTDFIFSAVGEELGFIGSVIIIAILCLIVLQCIRVARHAKDKKGMYIATGIGALVAFQTFINIGVATALLPNTGLPLPFISYGLSSLVSMSAGIGLVLNINLQKKKY